MPYDSLRLRIQGKNFKDKEWADVEQIKTACQKLDVVIAIVDTRDEHHLFIYHYIDEFGDYKYTNSTDELNENKSILKIAYTGNHYLSVESNPLFDNTLIPNLLESKAISSSDDSMRSTKKTNVNLTMKLAQGAVGYQAANLSIHQPRIPAEEYLPERWHLPDEAEHYIERIELLKDMKNLLNPENDSQRIVLTACHGLGGVGKTQLALHFAWQHYKQYKGVCFFSAESREKLIQEYIDLGQDLNLFENQDQLSPEKQAMKVKRWLENSKRSGWLLIYDNAPKYDEIEDLLPSEKGKILVTSRHKEWKGKTIPVDIFTLDEAKEYVIKATGLNEPDAIVALITLLDRLPLALAQACAYINRMKKTKQFNVSSYVELYKKEQKAMLSKNLLPANEHQQSVAITWNVTLTAIEKECPEAIELLKLCCYLHYQKIPYEIIHNFINKKESIVNDAIRTAYEYSMINIDESKLSISIHYLVQEVYFMQITTGQIPDYMFLKRILESVMQTCPLDIRNEKLKRNIYPHLQKLFTLAASFSKAVNIFSRHDSSIGEKLSFMLEDEILLPMWTYLFDICGVLGNNILQKTLKEGILILLEKHQTVININDPRKAFTYITKWGNAYQVVGESARAKALYEHMLNIFENDKSLDSILRIWPIKLLSGIYSETDKTKAENLLWNCLAIIEDRYGKNSSSSVEILFDLGVIKLKQHKYEEGLQLAKRAQKIIEYDVNYKKESGMVEKLEKLIDDIIFSQLLDEAGGDLSEMPSNLKKKCMISFFSFMSAITCKNIYYALIGLTEKYTNVFIFQKSMTIQSFIQSIKNNNDNFIKLKAHKELNIIILHLDSVHLAVLLFDNRDENHFTINYLSPDGGKIDEVLRDNLLTLFTVEIRCNNANFQIPRSEFDIMQPDLMTKNGVWIIKLVELFFQLNRIPQENDLGDNFDIEAEWGKQKSIIQKYHNINELGDETLGKELEELENLQLEKFNFFEGKEENEVNLDEILDEADDEYRKIIAQEKEQEDILELAMLEINNNFKDHPIVQSNENSSSDTPKIVEQLNTDFVKRKGLKISVEKFIHLPQNVTIGKAVDDGGCFFDALAQVLNTIQNTDIISEKYLRVLCHEFYHANKKLVNEWNKKDYGGLDTGEDYYFVQYTKPELDKDFPQHTPIWGRPDIEGKILCHKLNLERIVVIEMLKDPESQKPIIVYKEVTAEREMTLTEEEGYETISDSTIPILVVSQGELHFVPLLKRLNDKVDRKVLEISSSLPTISEQIEKNTAEVSVGKTAKEDKNWDTNLFMRIGQGGIGYQAANLSVHQPYIPPKENLPEIWHLPEKPSYFTGRENLLKEMGASLDSSGASQHVVLTTHGLGGVGKTQLALYFARTHCKQYKGVCFFHAENKETLIREYVELGDELNLFCGKETLSIEQRADMVKTWLEDSKRAGWLLIYDNALKYDEISKLLPTNEGKILITSRHTEWPKNYISLSVEVFEADEARKYVKEITGREEPEAIEELLTFLGRLPLALAQACAYIKENDISIKEYINLYKEVKSELLSNETLPTGDQHEPIMITWDITLRRMKIECPDSVELMYSSVFFHNENIPQFVLEHLFSAENQPLLKIKCNKARATAKKYSMIKVDKAKKYFSMHVMVQEIIKIQLQKDGKSELFFEKASNALISAFVLSNNNIEQIRKRKVLLSHLEKIYLSLEGLQNQEKYLSEEENILCRLIAAYYESSNKEKFNKIKDHYLIVAEILYGENGIELIPILNNISLPFVSDSSDNIEELEKNANNFRRAFQIISNNLENATHVQETIANCSQAHYSLADWYKKNHNTEKEKLYLNEAALFSEILQKISFGNKKVIASYYSSQASIKSMAGKTKEAIELYLTALKIEEEEYEEDHPELVSTLYNLGTLYTEQKNYKEAINYFTKGLDILEKKHEQTDHDEIKKMRISLSNAYHNSACYEHVALKANKNDNHRKLAEQHFEESIKIFPNDGNCIEYAQFMLQNMPHYLDKIDEVILSLRNALAFKGEDVILTYDLNEKITLDINIQSFFNGGEKIEINACLFAHYLLVKAYLLKSDIDLAEKTCNEFREKWKNSELKFFQSLLSVSEKIVLDAGGKLSIENTTIINLLNQKTTLKFYGVRDNEYKVDAIAELATESDKKVAQKLQQNLGCYGTFFKIKEKKEGFVIEGINLLQEGGQLSMGKRIQNLFGSQ